LLIVTVSVAGIIWVYLVFTGGWTAFRCRLLEVITKLIKLTQNGVVGSIRMFIFDS